MSNWVVVYFSLARQPEQRSPAIEAKLNALIHARALQRQGSEIIRIEGPGGLNISADEFFDWLKGYSDCQTFG
ncbi:hypothetical protein M2323_004023 [Rhodoblastus acidophilus]|uniref:hypothetical protein n=1 Tax=Rhodoblastus acidophilus TaxID=1074 RepID=UPI0016077B6C|nr:hypothetical protein [Rhodoblastus acidophilus]MCW2286185.1 hypothetical protein [Rhodoblastus acidophilus]MCW2335079.1 hypothetical protein [Rhodoblastus acidophilus]